MLNTSPLNTAQLNATAGGRAVTTFATRYTASITPVLLTALWSVAATCRRSMIATWAATPQTRKALTTEWVASSAVRKALDATWAATPQTRKALATEWAAAQSVRKSIDTVWSAPLASFRLLDTGWACSSPTKSDLATYWDCERPPRTELRDSWHLLGASEHTLPLAMLHIAGMDSQPLEDLELTQTDSSPAWMATASVLATCPPGVGAVVTLEVGPVQWAMILTDVRADRSSPTDGVWDVRMASPCQQLASTNAQMVMPYGGMASAVCAALCAPISMTWDCEDWYIAPPVLARLSGSCLDEAANIVAVVGVLLSLPDGTLVARPRTSANQSSPHVLEMTTEYSTASTGIRVSAWSVADSISVSGEGTTERVVDVLISPDREVSLLAENATLTPAVVQSRTVTETIALIDGVGAASSPIAAMIQSADGEGNDLPLFYWEGQRDIWAAARIHSPVRITYTTTFYRTTATVPQCTNAVHLLVEDTHE